MSSVLAVDLGGTKIRSALVTPGGEIVAEDVRLTEVWLGFKGVADRILAGMEVVSAGRDACGVGVAVPAYLEPGTERILFAPNLKWRNVDLKRELEDALGLPVWLENDANLAALGEHRYGAGRGFKDLVYITVSTGVGSGLVLGGRLYTGTYGGAGEFGHMVVDPEGPTCSCGNRGCLEGVASGCAIKRKAQELIKSGSGRRMLELAGGDLSAVDSRIVGLAAREGDPEARAILATAGRYLGIAIASVANLLNPAVFIVGGGVARGVGDYLLKPAVEEAYHHIYPPYRGSLKILPAALEGKEGVLGAAVFALERLADRGNN
ncbi:MAG: Glucokinase GlkA [Thermacetogenium phaeum]|jgi:glucokinase|uniref:Glucokinase GlkA n=1 Tax=Thermacetogenium phaeum TaxID=85874 RepID=A0A101FFV0_9THEO|nr:MAG: Glucokinase GlkA [Thermacetogenium phaeum]